VIAKRPILRYHGGKWKLAPWIISQMPAHRVYVEPFGGGGSVLLRKPRSYAEVYNDKWDTVVNVFRVMRDPQKAEKLKAHLELTPFSRTEFMEASLPSEDDVDSARRTILRSFAGFKSASTNGDFSTGFRANYNRSGTTPAHDWVNYPTGIRIYVERLRGVTVENKDAIEVIEQHDSPSSLFFVDPPYVHATRNMQRGNASYACEMSDEDHRNLSDSLHHVRGMVMLCGYDCDLYRDLFADWHRLDREAMADGARPRTESLWFNSAAWNQKPQQSLFMSTSERREGKQCRMTD
jgi:DNA adenine methylase